MVVSSINPTWVSYSHVWQLWQQAFTESGGKPDLAVYKKVIEKNFGAGTDWQVNLGHISICIVPESEMS